MYVMYAHMRFKSACMDVMYVCNACTYDKLCAYVC